MGGNARPRSCNCQLVGRIGSGLLPVRPSHLGTQRSALSSVIATLSTLLLAIVWAIFAIAYQQFENYVVQPRIQSKASALDPFVVVVAALFGGALLGIIGALVAIPAAAALRLWLDEVAFHRLDNS